MTVHHQDDWLTIHQGDVRDVLPTLPADSVDCIVTSPPYWGLRDYGTATWLGGSEDCVHSVSQPDADNKAVFAERVYRGDRTRCRKCGAVRQDQQLGLERTPEEYVANMVAVFRELRRVLKPSGTCWLNLGDSYAGSWGAQGHRETPAGLQGNSIRNHPKRESLTGKITEAGLKPKDLVGIPWRVAFALQADGWVLRSDVVWSKPNPMPESVTDRPTKAHEMLFLLTKAKRIGPEPTKYDDIPEGEARWLAALFDGEGSLVCRREADNGDEYGAHSAQVSIGSTSRALLDRLAAVIGEGSVLERGGTNAPMFYWQTSGKRALGLLRRLYPFLVVKQRQARCLIALEERKMVRGGHKRLEAKEITYRDRIWQAVKTLNHFGLPDLTDIPEPVFGRWTSQPYYFDADAVREEVSRTPGAESRRRNFDPAKQRKQSAPSPLNGGNPGPRSTDASAGRNLRSVWTIATRPYPGAHFAVFPPELPERCIKAGSSERGVCPECGAPWVRQTTTTRTFESGSGRAGNLPVGKNGAKLQGGGETGDIRRGPVTHSTTTGWAPACRHETLMPEPAVVLDPFAGSGTTGMVANRLSRRAILVDLNGDYLKQQLRRNAQTPLGLGV